MLEKLIANKISDVKSKIVELKSEDKEFSATTLVEKVSCIVLKKVAKKMDNATRKSLIIIALSVFRVDIFLTLKMVKWLSLSNLQVAQTQAKSLQLENYSNNAFIYKIA